MWDKGKAAGENPLQVIDPLENYKEGIKRAQEELLVINNDIENAKQIKKDLEDNNVLTLISKQAQLDKLISEANALKLEANTIHSNNTKMNDLLQDKHSDIDEEHANLISLKSEHEAHVNSKESHFFSIEQDIKNENAQLDKKKLVIWQETQKNEEILNNILDEHKNVKATLNLAMAKRKDCEDMISDAESKLEEAKQLNGNTKILKNQCDEDSIKANQTLKEALDLNAKADEKLSQLADEKKAITNLIIDNMRIKLEAQKSSDESKSKINECKLKIAELNELKEALAKQEK